MNLLSGGIFITGFIVDEQERLYSYYYTKKRYITRVYWKVTENDHAYLDRVPVVLLRIGSNLKVWWAVGSGAGSESTRQGCVTKELAMGCALFRVWEDQLGFIPVRAIRRL